MKFSGILRYKQITKSQENLLYNRLCRSNQQQCENQRKPKEKQVRESSQRTKKAVEHEGDDEINYNWRAWNSPQRFGKGTERVENRMTNQGFPNNSIVGNGQNT